MLPLAFVIPFLLLALLPLPLFWFLFSLHTKNLVCVIPFELHKVKDLVCLIAIGSLAPRTVPDNNRDSLLDQT